MFRDGLAYTFNVVYDTFVWPLLLMWCMVRNGFVFTLNALQISLWFDPYF